MLRNAPGGGFGGAGRHGAGTQAYPPSGGRPRSPRTGVTCWDTLVAATPRIWKTASEELRRSSSRSPAYSVCVSSLLLLTHFAGCC